NITTNYNNVIYSKRFNFCNRFMGCLKPISNVPPALSFEVIKEAIVATTFYVFLIRLINLSATVEGYHVNGLEVVFCSLSVYDATITAYSCTQSVRVITQGRHSPLITLTDSF